MRENEHCGALVKAEYTIYLLAVTRAKASRRVSVKANLRSRLSGEAAAGTNTRTQQCATHPKRGISSKQSDAAAT